VKFLSILISALEWYDQAICITLMSVISKFFFPDCDKIAMFLLYFSSLAIGYSGRPLGAYIFGYYSDKHNRLMATYYSLLLMVSAGIGITLIPTYQTVGIISSILFVAFRFLQGIALGGNYSLTVAVVEQADRRNRYYLSSYTCFGVIFGFMLGSASVSLLHKYCSQEILAYMWRLPFLLCGICAVPALIALKKIAQTHSFSQAKKSINSKISFKLFIQLLSLLFLHTIPFYVVFIFAPNYSITLLSYDASTVWKNQTIGMCAMLLFTPIFGMCADKVGPLRCLKFSNMFFVIFCALSYFQQLPLGLVFYIISGITIAVCYGCLYGYVPLMIAENIRARISNVLVNVVGVLASALVSFGAFLHSGNHLFVVLLIVSMFALGVLSICHEGQK